MDYIEIDINIDAEFAEIILAEFAEIGFDSFLDKDDGLLAYCTEKLFDQDETIRILGEYQEKTSITYQINKIAKQNWNEEWESHFDPIDIEGKVYIRADFHSPADSTYQHEIVIVPKMSFGTGHHETTSQMISLQMEIDHQGKSVLDVGTGTGILAIMAHKLGASKVHSFDIDDWSVENAAENYALNQIHDISIEQGTISTQKPEKYDIVLANINRNIILEEIARYAEFTKEFLLLSGFYLEDISEIQNAAEKSGFKKIKEISKNKWAAVVFKT